MKLMFDVETNGLYNCSVLSFSALVLDDNNNIIDTIDRYYYRDILEDDNMEALNINGLYKEVIKEKRKNVKYAKYFYKDKSIPLLFNLCDTLIAHNIDFDLTHIQDNFKDINVDDKELYCTMKEVQYLYNAPYYKNGEPKYPKLSEAVAHFNIDIDKIKDKTKANYHDSLFDVYCTYEIYKRLNNDS